MEQKKKDEIMTKVYNNFEEKGWGENKSSINQSITIDHDSEKVIFGITEREKEKLI